MNKIKGSLLLLIALSMTYIGCNSLTGNIPTAPYIELISVSPTEATAFRDSIEFTLFYRDGNGDLGENSPEAENLWIQDSRNQVTYQYRIPALAPEKANVAIQGTLKIALESAPLIAGLETETVSYTIWLEDHSGQMSQKVKSPEIKLIAQKPVQ